MRTGIGVLDVPLLPTRTTLHGKPIGLSEQEAFGPLHTFWAILTLSRIISAWVLTGTGPICGRPRIVRDSVLSPAGGLSLVPHVAFLLLPLFAPENVIHLLEVVANIPYLSPLDLGAAREVHVRPPR